MVITLEQLTQAFPTVTANTAKLLVTALNKYMSQYGIDKPLQVAAFLAQVGHESGGFTRTTENMNYSADRLRVVFKKYFTSKDKIKDSELLQKALAYSRNPQKIGSYVYANRMGNGDEASGEGYKHRGVGYIQITGKDNQTKMAQSLGMELDEAIEYAKTVEGAVHTACIFWAENKLNKFADTQGMVGLTKAINGGTIGLEDRIKKYKLCTRVLGLA